MAQIANKVTSAPVTDDYLPDRLLVWEDDFDGNELDPTSWIYLQRADGSGNNQLEINTYRPKNVKVEYSNLVITAFQEHYKGKEWTAANVNTSNLHAFQYGRIEAKMKLPKGKGLWPAFWTLGESINMRADEDGVVISTGEPWPEGGEIDILEYYNTDLTYASALHWQDGTGHGQSGAINLDSQKIITWSGA